MRESIERERERFDKKVFLLIEILQEVTSRSD